MRRRVSLEDAALLAVVKLADELDSGVICSDVKSEVGFRFNRKPEHSTLFKRLSILHDEKLIRPLWGRKRKSEITKKPQQEWVATAKGRRHAARIEARLERQERAA